MNVTLNLPEATLRQLKERAAQSGQTLEEYLQRLAVREADGSPPGASEPATAYPPGFSSPQEWAKAFNAWMQAVAARADRYPPGFVVDDSRETIYEGRDE